MTRAPGNGARPVVRFLPHQTEFVTSDYPKFIGLVGGYRAGKTEALVWKAVRIASLNVGFEGALFEPIHSMIGKILVPKLDEICQRINLPGKHYPSKNEYRLFFPTGQVKIHLLSAENYSRAVGLSLAWFGIDELDVMKPDVAEAAWRVAISRLTSGNLMQGFTTSTPEGYKFMYQYFEKNADATKKLIRASTRINPFIDDDYIATMEASYPPNKLKAYLEGQFVNMMAGSVYEDYDPVLNNSTFTLYNLPRDLKTLHVGMDFNVGADDVKGRGISIVTHAIVNSEPHAIHEMYGSTTTRAAIKQIKDAYPGFNICVYPDASGMASKTSADSSDRAQLAAAGFDDMVGKSNGPIHDRVNAMNAQFLNGQGKRRYRVNQTTCPIYSECLEQQPWDIDKQKPEKNGLLDGPVDAAGYFINNQWPVLKASFSQASLGV